MIPSRAKRRRRRGRLALGDLSGADYPFFHPFFFATRDERGNKTGGRKRRIRRIPPFLSSKDLSPPAGSGRKDGPVNRGDRIDVDPVAPVTWIHPESNLPATQTRWLNALICTRLCDRDGKGRGGEVYMYIDASDGERFGR